MSGTISPAMIIAAAGLMAGSGLGVSANLTSTLSSFNSSVITQTYGNLIAALNGANVSLPTMPSYFTGLSNGNSGTSVTSTISSTAASIAPDTKKFINNFSSASAFGAASFAWSAAITDAASKGFDDFGAGMSKFSDMASGGLSQIMSPGGIALPSLPSAPGISLSQLTAKPDFAALGSTIGNFGKAFDTSNLQKMFEPEGFIVNLQKQGLGDAGGLNDKLQAAGLDPTNLTGANPEVLKQVLSTVTGDDLQKIVKQTGMVLPPTASVTSAADFLDAKKILPGDVLSKLPGGNLAGLGNALTNMGGNFKDAMSLSKMLSSVKVPTLPFMDSLSKPVPDDIMASFKPMLGAGSGPFGNPTVNDIIGTAAGHGHTDAFTTIVSAHASIMQSPLGQALKVAADDLAADPTNSTKLNTFISAQAAVTNSTNGDLSKIISDSAAAFTTSTTQLATETSNLATAGITPSAATVPAPTQLLGMASKLHDLGVDKMKLGYNEMLNSMAGASVYGDAIKATLIEGQNIAKSAAAGIQNSTKIDPMAVLAKVQAG